MAKINDALRDLNPWWKGEFEIEYKQREIYEQIKKILSRDNLYRTPVQRR